LVDNGDTLSEALPGYEIGAELGRGAFGVVIAGRHRQLGREVAIKQLAPGLVTTESVRSRFLVEAQVLASISHPHIVPVYDYVERDDACILVMERLGGGTVWSRFVSRGFDQRSACAIVMVACSGLSAAHQRGVLHRDMKPENILFGDDSSLKVTDFGIARVLGEDDALATRGGEILGTPAYMAPEQASGADLGPTTDVYAAGVMLYELLSGRLPYPDDGGSLATVLRHINEDATSIADVAPTVPSRVCDVVMQAIARNPAERFETAEAFGVAIGQAASASWGGGWMDHLGIALREPGAILSSAQSGSAGGAANGANRANEGVVRPVLDLHAGGAAETGLEISDLMPLRQTPVAVPAFPTRLTWAALLVGVIALVLGLLGIGSSTPTPVLGKGSVTVAGHDPAAGGRVPIDLNRSIRIVVGNLPASAGVPTTAQLVLSLGGVSIVRSTSVPFVHGAAGLVTTVDASAGRYIVGGKLSATLKLVSARGTVNDAFGVQAARSPFATFGGVVGLVLLLVVAAYAESLLRSLRRGRRRDNRVGAVVGLVVVGAVGGLTATLWGWMLGIDGPTLVSFVLPAAVGAVAGLLAGLAGWQVGDRTRARRQSNRLVLVARRSPTLGGGSPPLEAGG
jgi:serine/threonine-protein kinase